MKLQRMLFLVRTAWRVSAQMVGMATNRKSQSEMWSDAEMGMRNPEVITVHEPVRQMEVEAVARKRWMRFCAASG